jgi:uncharacterized protein (DUF58 family)
MSEPPAPPRLTRARLRLSYPALPWVVLLLAALAIIAPSRVWTAALVMLGGAWLAAWLWARWLAAGLSLEREVRYGWAQVGDRLEERFTLANPSSLPALWVEIEDLSTLPGGFAGQARSLDPASRQQWRSDRLCHRRGMYTLGPTRLRSSDPFNLYRIEIEHLETTSLLVLPPVVPLPQIEIAAGGRAGEGRRRRAGALERTVNAAAARPYMPGDPLHQMHWPTSARMGSLYLRTFDSTPASDWWILVDLDQAVQAGEGPASTEEHAVILAASLAGQALRQKSAVGLAVYGRELAWLPPQGGPGQHLAILRALALSQSGARPLESVLERLPAHFARGASLIIITPAAGGRWAPGLLRLLAGGATPTVLLLDPISFGLAQPAEPALAALRRLGVLHHLIPRQMLDRPEAYPGRQGVIDYRVTPHGRVVTAGQPGVDTWRRLR